MNILCTHNADFELDDFIYNSAYESLSEICEFILVIVRHICIYFRN